MRVVACVKCVPEGRARLDPGTNRLDRSRSSEVNTFDLYAVEEALRIKEAGDCEVVVVSMGPETTAEALRVPLALGADRVVLVADSAAAGSDMLVTSKLLAKAIEREKADLILFGQQTSDGAGAVLWAAVAELLKLPAVSQVTRLEIADRVVRATRQTEVGDDVVEAPLPAIIAVTDAINELRYASLKGKMAAKKKPLEVLSLSNIGVAPTAAGGDASNTHVLRVADPPRRPNAVRIEGEDGSAESIVDFLVARDLV